MSDAPGRRRRILIVDDHPSLARAVKRMLAGHDVETVDAVDAAIALIEAGDRFDLILCDLMMPELSGIDLYAALRERAPDQVAKIVFMTGGAFTPEARQFVEDVPNPTLEKPFDRVRLFAVVDALLR